MIGYLKPIIVRACLHIFPLWYYNYNWYNIYVKICHAFYPHVTIIAFQPNPLVPSVLAHHHMTRLDQRSQRWIIKSHSHRTHGNGIHLPTLTGWFWWFSCRTYTIPMDPSWILLGFLVRAKGSIKVGGGSDQPICPNSPNKMNISSTWDHFLPAKWHHLLSGCFRK